MVDDSIQIGAVYLFRYRAKNLFGWSDFSEPLHLYAAKVPDTIDIAVTFNEDTNVRISWELPTYNGGLPIISYRIKIETLTINTFITELTYCNGADPVIRANRYCIIPMSKLISTNFNLPLGRVIKARVEAENLVGYS